MRKRRRGRRWLYISLGLLALIVLVGMCTSRNRNRPPEVEVGKVSRQSIVEMVNASGKVQPVKEVKISGDISGEIIELPVKEGERVKKGQLLARIRPDQYQREVEKAAAGVNSANASLANSKAAYAQAQVNLEKVKLVYNRNKGLYKEKAISDADMQNSEAEFKVAQAQLEAADQTVEGAKYSVSSASASLKEAQSALIKTEIYSPIDGIISKLNRSLGEHVVGTAQMEGTEMMRVADLNVMEVQVDVNENDIVKLKLGDTADVDVDAYQDKTFKGLITDIASSSSSTTTTTEKVTNFTVKVRLLPESYRDVQSEDKSLPTPFRPGMSANVSIRTKRVDNALAVPILAVTVRDQNDKRDSSNLNKQDEVVFVLLPDNTVKETKVKTGIQNDTYIEIKEGLKESDVVVSGPYAIVSRELKDSQKVERKKDKDRKS